MTCPTFHDTLDTEKSTSDNDWKARKEIVCALQCIDKRLNADKTSTLGVATESWSVEE